jgi:hypothetical protein
MIKEKVEAMQMWKTGYKREKPKSEKKKRKCMTCATEFISTWNGNRVCESCLISSLWKSGPNYYIQGLNLSDSRFKTPVNLPSSFKNKKKANEQHTHDEIYLLDEEFDN